MSTTLFQLIASGQGQTFPSSTLKISSKRVFTSREAAIKHIPKFITLCTTIEPSQLDAIDPETCKVRVLELELFEEEDGE